MTEDRGPAKARGPQQLLHLLLLLIRHWPKAKLPKRLDNSKHVRYKLRLWL